MYALTGSARLFRLQLRLDRIKLPLTVSITLLVMLATLAQLGSSYSDAQRALQYAMTMASSAVSRLFNGAITGPSLGEITIVESFFLLMLIVCLANIFLVVRHTRKNEEEGRNEVIGSLVVGRHAQLTSTLAMAFVMNVLFTLGLIAVYNVAIAGIPMDGVVLYCVGIGLMGMFFAGVAGVSSQLFDNSRSANGFASMLLLVAWLLRGLGDLFGTVNQSGTGIDSSFLSYLSPLGWVTNTRPFSGDEQVWLLGLLVLGTVGLIAAAYILLSRRDLGGSTFQSKPGRAEASAQLLRPMGLVWRLNRVAFLAWLANMAIMGFMVGAAADEFAKLIAENEGMRQVIEMLGGEVEVSDLMFAGTFAFAAIAITGYGMQILSRLRAEESSGRLELVLATPLGRLKWIGQYVLFAIASSLAILFVTGFTSGLTYGFITGDGLGRALELGAAIMAHAPAIVTMLGFVIVLFGLIPRAYVIGMWVTLFASVLVMFLGGTLGLPQWVVNIAPYTHSPAVPVGDVDSTPLWAMTAVAVGLLTAGLALYRRRDLVTE